MPVTLAGEKDFLDVMFLLNRCTQEMNRRSMFHWNRFYPGPETISADIRNRNLYICHDLGIIQGMIVLNQDQAEEYNSIDWKHGSGKILVVHRLAVHPVFQNRGIGKQLMEYAIERARVEGFGSLRLDVYSDQPAAGKLYRNMGFREAGSFHFPFQESPFICFEKKI